MLFECSQKRGSFLAAFSEAGLLFGALRRRGSFLVLSEAGLMFGALRRRGCMFGALRSGAAATFGTLGHLPMNSNLLILCYRGGERCNQGWEHHNELQRDKSQTVRIVLFACCGVCLGLQQCWVCQALRWQ